jgi:hypothetical protein
VGDNPRPSSLTFTSMPMTPSLPNSPPSRERVPARREGQRGGAPDVDVRLPLSASSLRSSRLSRGGERRKNRNTKTCHAVAPIAKSNTVINRGSAATPRFLALSPRGRDGPSAARVREGAASNLSHINEAVDPPKQRANPTDQGCDQCSSAPLSVSLLRSSRLSHGGETQQSEGCTMPFDTPSGAT